MYVSVYVSVSVCGVTIRPATLKAHICTYTNMHTLSAYTHTQVVV